MNNDAIRSTVTQSRLKDRGYNNPVLRFAGKGQGRSVWQSFTERSPLLIKDADYIGPPIDLEFRGDSPSSKKDVDFRFMERTAKTLDNILNRRLVVGLGGAEVTLGDFSHMGLDQTGVQVRFPI